MSHASSSTAIVLNERPARGPITDKTFRVEKRDVKEPGDGEVLVQVTYASVDPTMRGWLNDVRSYLPPVALGDVMRAGTVGRVVTSKSADYKAGDLVLGYLGWQEYWTGPASQLQHRETPQGSSDMDHLGLFGMAGMTAYIGIFDIGHLKEGDKKHIVISGAAGSVGLVVTQIALAHKDCTVTAIAGSQEKLDYLKKLGVHNALNYKDADFKEKFKKTGNVDIYFDNVGGEILDMVLAQLNPYARIVACGAISQYNATETQPIYNSFNLISMKSTMQGFIVMDHANRYKDGAAYLAGLVKEGKLEYKYHVVDGLEKATEALREMFDGKNYGKTIVKVAGEGKSKL